MIIADAERDAQRMRGEGDAARLPDLRARLRARIRSSTRSIAACRPTSTPSARTGDLLVVTPRRRVLQVPEGFFQGAPRRVAERARSDSACRSIFADLLAALGLFLVLEGIAPFLNPRGVKRALARLAEVQDRELRIAGLGSMLVGIVILFLVR